MNWNGVIERNREALKRVLAMLAAMVRSDPRSGTESQRFGFPGERTPEAIAEGRAGPHADGPSDCRVPIADCRPTLPRHLHRAVLRLLRPAEAAARRLIVVAAQGIVVTLPKARPPMPEPNPVVPLLRSLGIAVTGSADEFSRLAAGRRAASARKLRARASRDARGNRDAARIPCLPLFDPIRLPKPDRRRYVPPHAAPRISVPGFTVPHRLPPPPAPDDPLDATRLHLRLQALAAALDDLPKHATRFARWKARRDRDRADGRRNDRPRRLTPLKPGRPPGSVLRPTHEVHDILADLQHFARQALAPPDTS